MSVRVTGVAAETVKLRLSDAAGAKRAAIIKQDDTHVWARVYPKGMNSNGALARGVAEVTTREGWKIEELHTEEGRLDEVFRTITLPDTADAKEEAK